MIAYDEKFKARLLNDALTSKKLELTILPTEKCNFRCVYCYEDFIIGRMKPEIVEGVKRLLDQRLDELDKLVVRWFGGEPLLAYNVITDIMGHIAKRKSSRTEVSCGITTNASLLTPERIAELVSLDVRLYHISLDGFSETHDITRQSKDGGATFPKIWKNLVAFSRMFEDGQISDARVLLRLHVHPGNVDAMMDLVTAIKENLSPSAVKVYPAELAHLGGKNDKDFAIFKDMDQRLLDTKNMVNRELWQYNASSQTEEPLALCYAGKANAFIIRPDGRIAKCSVALKDDRNFIGRLDKDGRMHLQSEKVTPWLHALDSMNPEELECPMNGLKKVESLEHHSAADSAVEVFHQALGV